MHEDVDGFEAVVSRLKAIGQRPVEHALEERVLARAHRSRQAWLYSTKLKVAAALASGFMIGSVGLASAGALPGSAQDVAHSALGVVGVHVPPGHDRYTGPECDDATNHGQYVKAHSNDPAAGESPCGKPTRAVTHPEGGETESSEVPGDSGRHGPPPWAGQGKANGKGKGDSMVVPDSPSAKPTDGDGPKTTPTTLTRGTTTTEAAIAPSTTVVPEPTTTSAPEPTTTTTTTTETTTSTTAEVATTTTTTMGS